MMQIQIRRAHFKSDWKAIRDICCLTGAAGAPIATDRRDFFGEFWIGPYQKLWPAWTWVCEEQGRVMGYLTGCPNTALSKASQRRQLALALLRGRYPLNKDVQRFLKRSLGIEKDPESSFGKEFEARLHAEYPAHLHMNFRAEARRGGRGRKIVETFCQALREQSIPGLHVFCGETARSFYLKAGFHDLKKIEYRPGVWVFCLGVPL